MPMSYDGDARGVRETAYASYEGEAVLESAVRASIWMRLSPFLVRELRFDALRKCDAWWVAWSLGIATGIRPGG